LHTSIALDGNGLPHISYQYHSDYSLKYAHLKAAVEEDQEAGHQKRRTRLIVSPNPFTHNTVVEFVVRLPLPASSARSGGQAGALPRREQAGGSQPEADEPLAQEFVDEKLTSIEIHDAAGRLVKTLVNEEKKPGRHEVTWNAKGLPAGIYFAKFKAGDYKEVKKLILMR
jgi:hypothetical protein